MLRGSRTAQLPILAQGTDIVLIHLDPTTNSIRIEWARNARHCVADRGTQYRQSDVVQMFNAGDARFVAGRGSQDPDLTPDEREEDIDNAICGIPTRPCSYPDTTSPT